MKYFLEKSLFLFSDKSRVQKSGDVIICFFCSIKKKIQTHPGHSCTPHPPALISMRLLQVNNF